VSGRCSPTQAVNLLRREFSAMESADRLTQAIHRNKCRLYCDREVVPAHFRKRLMVVARLDPDGRWTAAIVSAVREAWKKPSYQWEFDIDEVVALLPARRGVKGVNWEIHATIEMEDLGRKAALDLHNSGQLMPHLKRFLQQEIGRVPKDNKVLTKAISAFLHPPELNG
jgi:hypothetical protein